MANRFKMSTLTSFPVLVYVFLIIGMTLFGFIVIVRIITPPYPNVYRSKKEKKFYNPSTQSWEYFPSLEDPFQIHLSVIVPAYNEEERLPPMLNECIGFLENRASQNNNFKYEIIIVSDGSRDKTAQVGMKYTEKYGAEKIRVLELETNRGKGGAVHLGVQSARGAVILFADADGATKFEDIKKLEYAAKKLIKSDYVEEPDIVSKKEAIICGSRAHLEKEAIAKRSLFRNILMHGFHFLVWFFAFQCLNFFSFCGDQMAARKNALEKVFRRKSAFIVRTIRDTQCGFKLLTRRAAYICFKSLHVRRWAFDVELLYIAEQFNIPISEVSVRWTEIEGSKLVPVWSWLQMGKDLCFIWFKYRIGAWKLIDCIKKK